ncbi:MAG TPA: glycine--tRNA ligase [Thermoplasmata archaeon]|nr:glycine--tRNA ligase [Thermoplasmata archaeon]
MKADELYALLRRRGFLWPTAEIYGGAAGLYDYGPLGAALKRRVEDAWSRWFVGRSEDYYLIEAAEILPEAVVRASGHLENFTDPEVVCDSCHSAFRAETVLEKVRPEGVDGLSTAEIADLVAQSRVKCPTCGSTTLSVPRPFNMMFGIDIGVTGKERAYLRPETAQSSYLAFPRMWDVGRRALPLGVAVIGRAYRNEIAPRQVLFRMRAFTQAELQIFFAPDRFPLPFADVSAESLPVLRAPDREAGRDRAEACTAAELVASGLPEFYVFHLVHQFRFFRDVLGFPGEAIRLFEKSEKERAFYNRIQFDFEVQVPSLGGFKEIGAVHYRGDYDLTRHGEGAARDLSVAADGGGRVLPHVLELTFGVDRALWALADRGIAVDGERTVWKLPPYLAPVAVGVLPLLKKEHTSLAREVVGSLLDAGVTASLDDAGSIGRRYARFDEAGTPFCVTIDGESVDAGHPHAGTVTLRERDSKTQSRVPISGLADRLRPQLLAPHPPRA